MNYEVIKMVQNNPDFTETKGTVSQQTSQFNGMADTKVYSDAEKNNFSNPRPTDPIQDSIYTLPDRKIIFQDLESALNGGNSETEKTTELPDKEE